jgi:hypothetical protein
VEFHKVKIKRIIGPTPNGAAVLLGNDKKTFVVFVGFYEAAALIREINHEIPARPLTHELIQNIFLGFDVEVKQVIISTIIENTFCATLILQQRLRGENGKGGSLRNEVRIDARPSDCLVLALKSKVDIFVTDEVFNQVQDVSEMAAEVESSLAGMALGEAGSESGAESGSQEGRGEKSIEEALGIVEGFEEPASEEAAADDDDDDDENDDDDDEEAESGKDDDDDEGAKGYGGFRP